MRSNGSRMRADECARHLPVLERDRQRVKPLTLDLAREIDG